ncbi:MAG: cupin domain-containing protein [Saprospiraceae bacterium]|nr:cupin domain-containing protein [Saprospiraceae bacterium]
MNHFKIDQIEGSVLYPGFVGHLVHTSHATYSYVSVEQGATLPPHAHEEEQVLHVLEGTLEVTVEDKTRICNSGEVVVIPGNAKHTVTGITQCWCLDVFTPRRQAYLEKGVESP